MKKTLSFIALIVLLAGCGGGASTQNDPVPPTPPAPTPAAEHGVWTTQDYLMPINPVHAILLNTGKVLFVAGSGNCPPTQQGCPTLPSQYLATVWTPGTSQFNTIQTPYDLFCNGAVQMPDGTVLLDGGTLAYATGTAAAVMKAMGMGTGVKMPHGAATAQTEGTPGHHATKVPYDASSPADSGFEGDNRAAIFDPNTDTFSVTPPMVHGRWYPTATAMPNGETMVYAGQDEIADDNPLIEFWLGNGWSAPIQPYCDDINGDGGITLCSSQFYSDGSMPVPAAPSMYPRMIVLPNGKVIQAGPEPWIWEFDPNAKPNPAWDFVGTTNYGDYRTYGSVVLLPLLPQTNYDPKILILGGLGTTGVVATDTTELIDMGQQSPVWVWGPSMSQPRVEMNATILPNGKVLAVGGSANDEDESTASLNADLYDPLTNTFSSAGTAQYPHLYHSTSILLPDGTVALSGGNPTQGVFEPHIEIYQPPYLFNADGSLATRPTMTGVPASVSYGKNFTVTTTADVAAAVLIHPGAPTHAFDMGQRFIGLTVAKGNGSITLTAPPNSNIAPPGYYMLFILNGAGVPSQASFVRLN